MVRNFPLEFVRVALEQTLYKEHIKNPYFFGGDSQVKLTSFFEQLKNQEEIDRFVETYRDLVDQQNRSGLIGNGILTTTENPTITNLYTSTIIPMTWACSIRCKLSDRDQMADTLFNLIEELKGSKVDIAELVCEDDNGAKIYVPFMVGTVGHNEDTPVFKEGDCTIEQRSNNQGQFGSLDTFVNNYFTNLDLQHNIESNLAIGDYFYVPRHFSRVIQGVRVSHTNLSVVAKKTNSSTTNLSFTNINYSTPTYDYANSWKRCKSTVTMISTQTFTALPSNIEVEVDADFTDQNGTDYTVTTLGEVTEATLDVNGKLNLEVECIWKVTRKKRIEIEFVQLSGTDGTCVSNLGTYEFITNTNREDVIYPPTHSDLKKYKMSLSFESLRVDQPRTINGDEYCEFTFGGSATIVDYQVKLGNDLVKVAFIKDYVPAEDEIINIGGISFLEPLEMPSGNGANIIPNQLMSNAFKINSHTDGLTLRLQYSFVLDMSEDLLKQWFEYGRYGIFSTENDFVSPNLIYRIREYWSSWGKVDTYEVPAKLVESIDIENTESDTLTLGVTFQIQGENN